MKKNKKVLFVVAAALAVLVITLGAVAIAQAATGTTAGASANTTTLWDKVAAIYKQNTGTTVNSADIQKAFTQAQKDLAAEAQDTMLQKMVADGKMTQKQADDYKKWLAARPEINTDALKQWMQSKPEGVPFGPGMGGQQMPGGMFRR
jgi:hypothetical protein